MARAYPLIALVVATLLVVGNLSTGIVTAQMDTGESYWGEQMINAIANLWPAAAIGVFVAFTGGAVAGFYQLDRATIVFLLAASAYLAYHFYWQPAHQSSVSSVDKVLTLASSNRRPQNCAQLAFLARKI